MMILTTLKCRLSTFLTVTMILLVMCTSEASARNLLKNLCRVKGQEENVLHGLGLVVGLSGTGDSGEYLPTMRILARSMELLRSPISPPNLKGKGGLLELKETKNVALVWVSVTIPPAGARRGDKLDCRVSAINAKSLKGGRLTFATLQGPNVNDPRVYALAEGLIHLEDDKHLTEGKVYQGCRLEEEFFNAFQKDGKITLVLDKNHADFQFAADVADTINSQLGYQGARAAQAEDYEGDLLARALDSVNIEVSIPKQYLADPVEFIGDVLGVSILEPEIDARVVINERTGVIVIGGDVEVGSVAVTHKNNVVVKTGERTGKQFNTLPNRANDSPKLQALVDALNALELSNTDIIDIIKGLDRNGKLHGRLIIE